MTDFFATLENLQFSTWLRESNSIWAYPTMLTLHTIGLALLAGADAVQLVSAILRHGPGHIAAMRQGLERWLEWQHLDSVQAMIGRASFHAHPDPASFERAHYIRTLQSWMR